MRAEKGYVSQSVGKYNNKEHILPRNYASLETYSIEPQHTIFYK